MYPKSTNIFPKDAALRQFLFPFTITLCRRSLDAWSVPQPYICSAFVLHKFIVHY